MPLDDGETITALNRDAKMTSTGIFTYTGLPTRSQTAEKTRISRKGPHHRPLTELAHEKLALAWTPEAGYVIEDILELSENSALSDIEHRNAFYLRQLRLQISTILAKSPAQLSIEETSLLLISYHYLVAMRLSKQSAFCTDAVVKQYPVVRDACLTFLKDRRGLWPKMLTNRIVTQSFGINWNDTPRKRRNSDKMRSLAEKADLFRRYEEMNDLFPKRSGAPHNALATASRFEERHRYSDLWNRLVRADPNYKEMLKTGTRDAFFDDDFCDFFKWAATNLEL